MLDEQTKLEYASRSSIRWYQKAAFQRVLWICASLALAPVALLVIVNAWDWGVTKYRTAKNQRLIQDASAYVPPIDQVVFEMDAGTVKTLVSAEPWVRWFPPDRIYPTIFLHSLSDPAAITYDKKPLVVLLLEPQLRYTYDGRTIVDRPVLCFTGYKVWNVSSTGEWKSGMNASLVILPQPRDRIKVYAAQIDPNDPSRFSFRMDYNGVSQIITSTFAHDTIAIEPKKGVTTHTYSWRYVSFWVPAGATSEQAEATKAVMESSGTVGGTSWPATPFGRAFNWRPGTTSVTPPAE